MGKVIFLWGKRKYTGRFDVTVLSDWTQSADSHNLITATAFSYLPT
jgi:hypothetical protein